MCKELTHQPRKPKFQYVLQTSYFSLVTCSAMQVQPCMHIACSVRLTAELTNTPIPTPVARTLTLLI